MKNITKILLKLIPLCLILFSALLLFGCGKQSPKELTVPVALGDAEGVSVVSQNPQEIAFGGSASFTIHIREGVAIDKISRGELVFVETITSSADGAQQTMHVYTLTLDKIYFPTTVKLETHDALSGDGWVLFYHTNGGIMTETGSAGIKIEDFSDEFYLCPNTLADQGHFERDGYMLLGYNTEPDGSGTFYGPGWNVVMPESKKISLHCMWSKTADTNDFDFSFDESGATITKYKGSDETVTLPLTVGEHKVIGVDSEAFAENKTLKTLIVPKNITTIKDNAFKNCTSLTKLYICDTVTSMTEKAFSGCDALSSFNPLAVYSPNYLTSRTGSYVIKYERLITAPDKKLVLTGGSNLAYGIDSERLTKNLADAGYDFSVVNMGANVLSVATFQAEISAYFMGEGDILIHTPEPSHAQWGANEITSTHWKIFEAGYDAFSFVDIRNYKKPFTSFAKFNKARKAETKHTYETHCTDEVNLYGDFSKERVGSVSAYQTTIQDCIDNGNKGNATLSEGISSIKTYGGNLNKHFDTIAEKGGTVLISFAVLMDIYTTEATQEAGGEQQTAYEQNIDKFIHGTRISSVDRYLMPHKYFYNSQFHLNSEGADIRSDYLAEDILNYLNSK